jgi:hypothetical protein
MHRAALGCVPQVLTQVQASHATVAALQRSIQVVKELSQYLALLVDQQVSAALAGAQQAEVALRGGGCKARWLTLA